MKSNRIIAPLFSLMAALFLLACGPSTEGETRSWERNKKQAAELSATYPTFKTALAAEEKKAKEAWDAAGKEGDEKIRATKMKAANEVVGSLVNRVNEVKYKIEGIEKTIGKLGKLKLSGVRADARKANMTSARAAIDKAKAAMAAANPANGGAAMVLLKPIIGDLISAQGTANRKLKALSPQKKKKKKSSKKKK
jgi:hypothetical protein